MPTKIFIHGLEGSNQGTKARFFRENFPDMLIPNFPGDLDERMEKLNGILSDKSGITLVGSSFGGLMASIFAMENECRVNKIILLAPAINLIGMTDYLSRHIDTPVTIYHGTNDIVIPLEAVETISEKCFKNFTFNRVEDDHSLHDTFTTIDWQAYLD